MCETRPNGSAMQELRLCSRHIYDDNHLRSTRLDPWPVSLARCVCKTTLLEKALASVSAPSQTVQPQSAANRDRTWQAPVAASPRQLRPAATATIATVHHEHATQNRARRTYASSRRFERTPEKMSTAGMLSRWTHVHVCVWCSVLAFVRARAGEQRVAFATLPCARVQLHGSQHMSIDHACIVSRRRPRRMRRTRLQSTQQAHGDARLCVCASDEARDVLWRG